VGHGPVAHARQRGRATGTRSSAPIPQGVSAARRLPPPGQATLRAAWSRRGPEVRRAGSRRAHRELFFTIATRVVSVDDDLGWGQIGVPHWGHFQTPNTEDHQDDGVARPPHRLALQRRQRQGSQPCPAPSRLPSARTSPRSHRCETASLTGRWRGVSCLRGNSPEQFLGGGVAATSPRYPASCKYPLHGLY